MLDQMIESRSGAGDGKRRGSFLLLTMLTVFAVAIGALLYSLFNKQLGVGGEDLELSTLVAPVPVPEEEPPPPPEKQPETKQVKAAPNADVRKEIIQAITESPKIPDKPSVVQSNIPPRREGVKTVVGDQNLTSNAPAPSSYRGPVSTDNRGVAGDGGVPNIGGTGDAPPPPPKPKPTPTPTPKEEPKPTPPSVPKTVSGGVVNGKATNLVKPPYPAAAKAVRASGTVNVAVTIDENGNVISASATSGHALLRQAAEQAARASKFSPTTLSGQKVKVTGVIVYNFTAQ